MTLDPTAALTAAKRTFKMEAEAVANLAQKLDQQFPKACELMLASTGRIIVTGMGKSGHIARKIAATLASTGTPAHFVHPGEASHGDMGMITAQDVVVALSNSGTAVEILTLLPLLKRLGVPLIAMTGNPDSALALASDAHLDTGVETEACPLDLAPTSSTTTALVMGDALAIALLEARGFTAEDFAFSHPGGKLGRKLLLKVADVMREGYAIPRVNSATKLIDALLEISQKGLGMTTVIDQDDVLLGLFTDGDLRRTLDKGLDVTSTPIREVMTTGAKTIGANHLAAEALNIMEQNKISALVVAEGNSVRGVIHLMDLLREGIA
ncbi:Arabinose 5-phosphate isomerase [Aequoribacter fuscus]|jgi:arabinose-5-phosphate isomerase|uniref:Arabinose 5-phosphate isomerase n=1 Tax=Aequoribacter fuscus TaxID=2518989 RepID=F3L686_9GAMM|nr:KpsF/GutQ family sugar-phosphate isomerase [Aequoribacter fuscus]EGG28155.1 Arabinose 5-phosphate isomerase [Aequoribacter fuscus]QHJ88758.1 KpsF/GutQ family sugar-phosphate isomerase [Aequoribacter fuscus]